MKAQNAGYYPPQLELLKGTKMLFKVEKISSVPLQFDGAFRVKRVCTDLAIMEEYDSVRSYSLYSRLNCLIKTLINFFDWIMCL
jgi:hypothetical protein